MKRYNPHKPIAPPKVILDYIDKHCIYRKDGIVLRDGIPLTSLSQDGYFRVQITVNGRTRTLSVAHIVWYLIKGTWPEFMIDHIDTVRTNNAIDNLRLAMNTYENSKNRRVGKNSQNYC